MGRSVIGQFGGVIVVLAVIGSDCLAQYPTYNTFGVTRYERDVVEADRGNPGNSQGAISYLDETVQGAATIGRNPNIWCQSGQNCNESTVAPTPAPIVRRTTINTFSPMTGMGSVMNSMAYANQAAALLVSPLSILKIAWGLTEPAIASGNEAAMTQASLAMLNRYASDEAYQRQARLNPHSEVILQAYRDCISKAMRAIAPGAMGPPAPGASWIEAVSKCQGGDSIVSTSTTPFIVPDESGFMFNDHNAHGLNGGSTDTFSPNNTYELSALDVVFNPVLHTGSWDTLELSALRASFRDLIGDIRLEIGSGSSGARQIDTTRMPPMKAPEETVREMTLEAYHSLHQLMWRECKLRLGDQNIAGAPSERELLERLTVDGFSFGKRSKDAFFALYRKRVRAQRNPNCDVLMSWEANRPTSIEFLSNNGNWASRTTKMTRIYFMFARAIAMARYLGSLRQAEMVVLKLGGGEVETTMRLAVLEAIHEVAGTSDIAGASMANLSDLRGIEAAVIQTLESSEKEGSSKKKR
jgi:hypothetical protein